MASVPRTEIPYYVKISRSLEPLIAGLQGKGAGLREAVAKLEHDPCATDAYKLVGPLRDRVCGLHMRRDYRLAFSFVTDVVDDEGKGLEIVAVLAIGAKSSGPRGKPPAAFELVHEIFGEPFSSGTLKREPCCAGGRPQIAEAELEDAMALLRRLSRRPRR
jgi:hypothetical protein